MKTIIMMIGLVCLSFGAFAQNDHAMHQQDQKNKMDHQGTTVIFKDADFTHAYGHYLELKDALVASDQAAAKAAAEILQKSMKAVKAGDKTVKQATILAKAISLADQRTTFTELSSEMAQLVKGQELTMGELYIEYCPMANNNSGGYWLSNEQEIKNPYFGAMMLSCGKVTETIQQ